MLNKLRQTQLVFEFNKLKIKVRLWHLGSVVLSFFIYQFLFGWKFSLLLVGGVLWHESCHLFVARKFNLKTGGIIMIPFIGGVSLILDRYKTYWQQALVALGGPIGGALSAFVVYIIFLLTKVPFFIAATYFLCFLNLFNLLPLGGILDGGQAMNTITYSINERIGFIYKCISTLLFSVLIFYINPVLGIFMVVIGIPPIYAEYRNRQYMSLGHTWMLSDNYLNKPKVMHVKQILFISSIWIGAAVIMVWLMYLCSAYGLNMKALFHH
jgi:Zn-dependent protease